MKRFFISLFALAALVFTGCGGEGGGGGNNPNFYSVTFYDGGIIINALTQSVRGGTKINLETREKNGYTFDGWLLNGVGSPHKTQFNVTGNTEFHAKFTPLGGTVYPVNFYDEEGGSPIPGLSRMVNAGETITLPPRTKTGYTFRGWRINNMGSALTGQHNVNQSVYFYAVFTQNPPDTVIEIRTVDDLKNMSLSLSADYKLMNNIILTGTGEWRPIGEEGNPFSGSLDGGGFKIIDLYTGSYSHAGLFGYLLGTVKNLGVEIATGGVNGNYAGGIAGYVDGGTITDSYSKGSVSSDDYAGGIAGYITRSTITNSYSIGSVIGGTSSYVGGIAGHVIGGSAITNSYSTGSVSGRYAGGIAGYVIESSAITRSYSTGYVIGSDAGGIVGYINGGTVMGNVAANTKIEGSRINRVVGTISNTFNITNTVSSNYARLPMPAEGGTFNTSSDGYGDSKSNRELNARAEYAALGWNFATLWHIGEGTGFPIFLWQEVTVTISVSVNGEVTERTVTDDSFTVPTAADPDPRFMWNTSSDGLGTTLTPGSVIRVSSDFTIYALLKGDHPNYPIEISTATELNDIRNMPTLHYRLASDISLSAYDTDPGWTPIGSESIPFSGSLDGGGFKITGLYINTSTENNGLFGNLTGTVKNLGVETEARGIKGGENNTGAIAGKVDGGTIINSYSTGSINAKHAIGGIAGYIDNNSAITGCYSTVNINAGGNSVGGIAGDVDRGSTITNSFSTGNVIGNGYVGGIAGLVGSGCTITNSFSTGDVSGDGSVGGIAGNDGGTITNNVAANANITITGSGSGVNRVVGSRSGGTITNNFANSGMIGSTFDTTTANYGVSKSLAELQTITPYSGTTNGDGLGGLGWQFGNDDAHPWVWGAFQGYPYPTLYWQTEAP